MMGKNENLFGDTAVLAGIVRWSALKKLSLESDSLKDRILHGSDYPLPPSRLPFLARIGLFPAERKNPLDLDWRIKRSFPFGEQYGNRILSLLGMDADNFLPKRAIPSPSGMME
jgi:hypothetical protein